MIKSHETTMATPTPATTATSTIRKLVVDVVDARDLLPKDGQGSSSPYVVADFDGQRKRTRTVARDLNPVWNETLEFLVSDPAAMESEELQIEVHNDKHGSNGGGGGRKNHFLGRVKLHGSQFAKKGEEGLVYYPLEKKSVFSWIKGELGMRVYYSDEAVDEHKEEPPPENDAVVPPPNSSELPAEQEKVCCPMPTEAALETNELLGDDLRGGGVSNFMNEPVVVHVVESPATTPPAVEVSQPSPEMRKMQTRAERVRVFKRVNGEFAPRVIPTRSDSGRVASHTHNLVEPMQYLFVRIVKARGIPTSGEQMCVKIRAGNHFARSKPAVHHRVNEGPPDLEWQQVFALAQNSVGSTLEISIWEASMDRFVGGVCFDLSDVPVRDPPDSPLAPQWYRLEGRDDRSGGRVTSDIMLSVWIGTQADDAFPESWNSDAQYAAHTRSKVYQSPKLWYLRVTVMDVQDLHTSGSFSGMPDIRVRGQLGFQSARTRRPASISHPGSAYSWYEDLIFVAGEPLEEQLIIDVEDRTSKEPSMFGHVIIPLNTVDQRIDESPVPAKWHNLEGGRAGSEYYGRIHLRICLEGGYHVLDEAAHVCSDFRPTAKQLWKPPVGVLELGILGARGLLPMKTKSNGGNKSSTDAYCVAKYGKKWVRTRTITDNFDPRWNEQYTWQVYDPCTVLTVGVFDNWRMFGEDKSDYRIGKVRIRVSTLESNQVYSSSYPLLVLNRGGLKKMGEIELAVRFVCPSMLPDTCTVYSQPLLPRMHYLRPLAVAQQEALRGAAIKMVTLWLARSEPPLGSEVIKYLLDADSHTWSMRKSKANWFRIMAVMGWLVGLAQWIDDIKKWRNPVTTVLVHNLYLVLVWYPELIVPTLFFYVFLVGAWYYRFKPKVPAGMDIRLSQADLVEAEELDEEFDPIPSMKPPEVIRVRYDRIRVLASRIQTVLGDIATQGERVQALVSWRDPRATMLFIGVCLLVALVLYAVPAKMVAVALGFYFLRHPMFRDPMPPAGLNFFRRLPSLSDKLI